MPEDVLTPFYSARHDHEACIEEALARAKALCAEQGLRLTPLRQRVFRAVLQGHAPVRAYAIIEQMGRERGPVAPPTVYRALEFLCQAGLVHRLESLNAYVGCGGPEHRHRPQLLICRRCGAVAEMTAPAISETVAAEAARLGFAVGDEALEVMGVCAACRAQ